MQVKSMFIGTLVMLSCSQGLQAGASCVVVKKLGDSQAIEWVAAEHESAASATDKAKRKLLSQTHPDKYQGLHPQASTDLPHAHVVIVKTEYETTRGRPRTSYGCGFSAHSNEHAKAMALYNLRNYSWGWKPEFGYQVQESFHY
ncbi:MAG: hypothetical protein QNJ78_12045 [Gammaproteobacteria bacterium]|nr:hypothetical protein [Gammaproteobacteria bacterium]